MKAAEQEESIQRTKEFLKTPPTVEEIEDLRKVLRYHEWKYYVQNDPVLADGEYDRLFNYLKEIEGNHPDLVTDDSPTQRVGSDLVNEGNSVEHLTAMLSLGNSYTLEDLVDFERQVRKISDTLDEVPIAFTVEPKFDGGSIALVYENGLLVRAATRGNGKMGEEMTLNAKTLPTVPLSVETNTLGIHRMELRGEAVIHKKQFEDLNKEREADGKTLFANPRNAATGGLRTKNPNETRERRIELFIFQISLMEDVNGNDLLFKYSSHYENLELLGSLGFKVPTNERLRSTDIKKIHSFIEKWEAKRDSYPYELDGMVVKVDDYNLQEEIGATQHHPRWAIAYKFKAKQARTILEHVEYQVGKVGSITPVAKLNPVHLAGVTVSSVSIHNEDFITSKDLRIGDTVVVERAGDVIPYIEGVVKELRDGSEIPIEFPEYCPINTTDTPIALVREEGESAWRCPTCVCGVQTLQRIIFHVSKDGMDIDGFGKSYVETFYENGWIRDMADVYNLDYRLIAELPGFGEKSANNLKEAIDTAKRNPLQKLLASLVIHHLGKKASSLIAAYVENIFDLKSVTEEELTAIKDIGPVLAKNIVEYFANDDHIRMLERMEVYGVNVHQTESDKPKKAIEGEVFSGKTILFTGTLQELKRNEAKKLAEQHGAKAISAVSKNLDILVVGEKAGSKLEKAQKLGTVQILTEAEFIELVTDS